MRAVRRGLITVLVLVVSLAAPAPVLADPTPGPSAAVTSPTAPPGPTGGSGPGWLSPIEPGVGPLPTQTGLAAALRELLAARELGGRVGLAVLDLADGTTLFSAGGTQALTPASITKLLTAAAVLATLGPDERLRTRTVLLPAPADTAAVSASPGPSTSTPPTLPPTTAAPAPTTTTAPAPTVVLVGGGDPLLSSLPPGSPGLPAYPPRAWLGDLVETTAARLRAEGITRVALGYDDSLFAGPRAAPSWRPGYTVDVVAPVSALSLDQGRIAPLSGDRVADPAARTAAAFATALGAAGITVVGSPTRTPGSGQAQVLGEIVSAPLAAIVEHMLVVSDNDVAEALAHHVALRAGRPGSFDDGAAATLTTLGALGVDTAGVALFDGSGLSRATKIPPRVLAATLALAARGNPRMRPMTAGLAVAGVNGTLALHFFAPGAVAGRGLIRAKTGSLQGVVSLAGVVPDADGRLLAFAVIADSVPAGYGRAARRVFERVATVLLSCGCAS